MGRLGEGPHSSLHPRPGGDPARRDESGDTSTDPRHVRGILESEDVRPQQVRSGKHPGPAK